MKGKPALFLTLTYDYDNIPMNKGKFTLQKSDYQGFMKRLRKRLPDRVFKYVVCGEYGKERNRPHYHMILVGADFDDAKHILASWGKGFVHFGTATAASIAYTFKYAIKGTVAAVDYRQTKEFVCMSKGIGEDWAFEVKYHKYTYTAKCVNKKTGEVVERIFTRYRKERIPKPHFKQKLNLLLKQPYYVVPSANGGTVKMSVPRFYLRAANYDSTELGELFQQRMTEKYIKLSLNDKMIYDKLRTIQAKEESRITALARKYTFDKGKL